YTELSVNDMVTFQDNAYYNPAMLCNDSPIASNPNVYATGADIPIDPTIDNTDIKLYAVWTPTTVAQAYAKKSKSLTMQNMTAEICGYITPNQWDIVTDTRDNQSYHIARLEDGRCWMLDNLDLNLNSSTVANALKGTDESGANTNATVYALNKLRNGGGASTDQWAKGTGLSYTNWGTTASSYIYPLINRAGNCTTTHTYPCTYDGSYNNTSVAPNSNFGLGYKKIGSYYNYCAATAGSYCYNDSHTDTNNASYDICSSNWRLPRGGTITTGTNYNEFIALQVALSNITITTFDASNPLSIQYMLSLQFSGTYDHSGTQLQGQDGFFWSSTYKNAVWMHDIHSESSSAWLSAYDTRAHGYSIRCIAQN
ncbi:hypothetical protein IJI18_00020, partial [Candidatus Saccharibacteria bacterium]|nr:hypothetical protein [Candidatus Saccharibacteria bacterium]